MMKKAIILGLVLSAGVFVSTIPADAGIERNGITPNGVSPNGYVRNGVTPNGYVRNGLVRNGISPTPGLDFTTISQQGLGK